MDIETTGLLPEKDQIISIGAVDFSSPQHMYYKECRLSRNITPSSSALEVTGFSISDLKDKSKASLQEIVRDFFRWTSTRRERTFAGENPWFDATLLQRSSSKYGITWPFGHRYVDLHSVSLATLLRLRKHVVTSNGRIDLNLDRTLKSVGLQPRKGFHNALDDAKLEAEAFSRLIYGKVLFKEYAKDKVPAPLRRRYF